jgi:hypothetical protein
VVVIMGLLLSELVEPLRQVIDDFDPSGDYENTDERLITYLKWGVKGVESEWSQGYTVSLNETSYEINPTPPEWLCMLYVLGTGIRMRAYEQKYSYQIPAIKITRTSKGEDLKSLQDFYDAIMQERRYSGTGYVFSSFDDLLTRPNLILTDLEKGYR